MGDSAKVALLASYREYVEAGGLMAYGIDLGELGRRMADDVHEILNGTKPGDIPIYQATKALSLVIPSALHARADEVIE